MREHPPPAPWRLPRRSWPDATPHALLTDCRTGHPDTAPSPRRPRGASGWWRHDRDTTSFLIVAECRESGRIGSERRVDNRTYVRYGGEYFPTTRVKAPGQRLKRWEVGDGR